MNQRKKLHDPLHVGYGITSDEAALVCNRPFITELHLKYILTLLRSGLLDPPIWRPRLSQHSDFGFFDEFGDLQSFRAGQ
jgi:hypothetical protein